jgi:hypothetical protein
MEVELEPARTGSLVYVGRDRSHIRAEYFYEHDEEWFQAGLAALRRRQDFFRADTLPPHPFRGREWSELPCKWCRHKKNTCKPDVQSGVTKMSESNGVPWAQDHYGGYDAADVRKRVLQRWSGKSGVSGHTHDPKGE